MHRKSMSVLSTGVCLSSGPVAATRDCRGGHLGAYDTLESYDPTSDGQWTFGVWHSRRKWRPHGDRGRRHRGSHQPGDIRCGRRGAAKESRAGAPERRRHRPPHRIHWNMQTDVVAEFDHISYGAWANGTNYNNYESVGDAYLTALDDARTPPAVMPMSGTATYLGQMTGFSKGNGVDGSIRHFNGDVEMTADFANAAMTVDLLNESNRRITLAGDIQGNVFSGTNLVEFSDTMPIQALGATAQFSGGFYGTKLQRPRACLRSLAAAHKTPVA